MPNPQNEALVKFITQRQAKLASDRATFEDRFQDVADYILPHREDIYGTLVPGQEKGRNIYDGTAVSAAILAADGIHGYHVSPAFPWFRYTINRKEVDQIVAVKNWLQEIEHNMYMALNRSNFYAEIWQYIYDGIGIGTSNIYAQEDIAERRIVFETTHPGENYIEENQYGEVDVFHRKRKISARRILQMFGAENLPQSVVDTARDHPFKQLDILHAVYPREEFDERRSDNKNKRFASVWYLPGTKHIARESGFDRFPHHVWRYMKTGKEAYGFGPGMLAMADIKGVNLMNMTLLGAAQQAIDPAYNVPSYLEGKVDLTPRGFNYVRDASDKITPVTSGMNFPVGIDREQAKQQAIRERFHVDVFLLLASLEGRGQRTAFEVNELMSEKAAILGAELGPFNDQIGNILETVYWIEQNAGRMPDPPGILQELATKDPTLRFEPEYLGPLAQAQKQQFAKNPIRSFLQDVAPFLEIQPDVVDNFDFDAGVRKLAMINNVPVEMVREEKDRDRIREARVQAAQQEEQAQGLMQAAEGIKTLSEADKNTGGQISAALGGASVPAA